MSGRIPKGIGKPAPPENPNVIGKGFTWCYPGEHAPADVFTKLCDDCGRTHCRRHSCTCNQEPPEREYQEASGEPWGADYEVARDEGLLYVRR